jgi:diguanylate cyclase (GGDEF)-like protein
MRVADREVDVMHHATSFDESQVIILKRRKCKMRDSVLIVDDAPNLHKLVRAYLAGEAIDVHSAFNGPEGIMMAQKLGPGVILLDVDMPHLNGFEVCERLKANQTTQSLPIIFLTADVSPRSHVKGLDMGADDYMTKRFKPDELRARIRAVLRNKPLLEETAMVDGITRMWNRAYRDLHLPAQLSFAQRTSLPLACMMVEIDGLDSIRMQFGEAIGVEVLRSAAHILNSQGRTEDMVCYLESGKFSVLMPGTRQAAATQLADRARAKIERDLRSSNGVTIGATCSFGIADTRSGSDKSLLDRADAALHCAKRLGTSRVSLCHGGEPCAGDERLSFTSTRAERGV